MGVVSVAEGGKFVLGEDQLVKLLAGLKENGAVVCPVTAGLLAVVKIALYLVGVHGDGEHLALAAEERGRAAGAVLEIPLCNDGVIVALVVEVAAGGNENVYFADSSKDIFRFFKFVTATIKTRTESSNPNIVPQLDIASIPDEGDDDDILY